MFDIYSGLIPEFDRFRDVLREPMEVYVRANPLRIGGPALVKALRDAGYDAAALPWYADGVRVRGMERPGSTLEWMCGLYHIQGATSMIPPLCLDVEPGMRVLDMCAAPGSKATQVAGLLCDRGFLVANDVYRDRLAYLKTHLERLGCTCACMTNCAADSFPSGMLFDRVLLDAPCSGEGTVRLCGDEKSREFAYEADRRAREQDLERLYGLQKALLRRAANVTRPGGFIVYSTCTYSPRENEEVLDAIIAERGDLALEPLPPEIGGEPALTEHDGRTFPKEMALARRFYPHRQENSFGFFVARMRRTHSKRPITPDRDAVWRADPPDSAAAEEERVLEALVAYGVEPRFVEAHHLARSGHGMWITSREMPHPALLKPWRPQNPGVRLYRDGPPFVKPSTFGAMVLGGAIRERVFDLEPAEVPAFLRGDGIPRLRAQATRFVAARIAGRVLGCGKMTGDGLRGEMPRRLADMVCESFMLTPGVHFGPATSPT